MIDDTLRIDKFLWFARLTKTRDLAQTIAEAGTIRIDGRRVQHAHVPVRVGSVLTVPLPSGVRVLRVEALPVRRGPASEAATLYTPLESIVPKAR